jgi:hypothetical protein
MIRARARVMIRARARVMMRAPGRREVCVVPRLGSVRRWALEEISVDEVKVRVLATRAHLLRHRAEEILRTDKE